MMPSLIALPIMVVGSGGGARWDSIKEKLGIELRTCSQSTQSLGPPESLLPHKMRKHLTPKRNGTHDPPIIAVFEAWS